MNGGRSCSAWQCRESTRTRSIKPRRNNYNTPSSWMQIIGGWRQTNPGEQTIAQIKAAFTLTRCLTGCIYRQTDNQPFNAKATSLKKSDPKELVENIPWGGLTFNKTWNRYDAPVMHSVPAATDSEDHALVTLRRASLSNLTKKEGGEFQL